MDKVKHTPGPWQIGDYDHGTVYDCAENGPVMVASCAKLGISKTEREANARLIAAAPDLLAALEYIATGGENWKDCCRVARAALARVKGE